MCLPKKGNHNLSAIKVAEAIVPNCGLLWAWQRAFWFYKNKNSS